MGFKGSVWLPSKSFLEDQKCWKLKCRESKAVGKCYSSRSLFKQGKQKNMSNYGMLGLKGERSRPNQFEEYLCKGMKGSNKLFFKQNRNSKPAKVSVELIDDQRIKRALGTQDHHRDVLVDELHQTISK